MTITTNCPSCDHRLRVKDELAGKRVRCPECKEPVSIEAAEQPVAQPAKQPAGEPAPQSTSAGKSGELARTCPECDGKVPMSVSRCPDCGANYKRALQKKKDEEEGAGGDSFALEKKAMNGGVLGGLALIAIAVVWFVLGWMAGYIYYYPPVLAVFGIVGVIKGLANPPAPPQRRSRRAR